jgi:2-succinyl-5-enolpyruvyl-6-hydroxy-3-cyclohexene-1-carboxylate synthase
VGASGIDGQVSTALGIGAATGEHVYAILGDITFYHDMNGLLAIKRNNVSATFIVINNNGGGIFERLPIREFEPYHTEYFLTPHGLTFEHAAAMYGLEYAVADDFASLDSGAGPVHEAGCQCDY